MAIDQSIVDSMKDVWEAASERFKSLNLNKY
jgi:hypothetical protein